MATSVTVTRTNNAEIDGLLIGTKWTGTVTYSFPDSPTDYLPGYSIRNEPTTGFSQAPAAEQAAIKYAVDLIKSYTGASIQFAGTNSADIQIAQSSAANPTSYAYYPSTSTTGTGGDVWFGTAYDYTQAKVGNYYFTTALHELGHALGLKHSQETGGVANVAVPAAHDDSEFTVMSYRSYVGGPLTGYTNEAYGYPQTYMANDILALQTLYGANFATQSGNTTYSWNPNTGQEFINGVGQPAPGDGAGGSANRVFMTVWDGGGNDTYDLSNYSTGVTINLNPGASSVTSGTQFAYLGNGHYAQGNIFNAYLYNNDARSYIENAIGGPGDDVITGNATANYLDGGAGNDTLTGGGGNDVIIGRSGTDTAVFSGARAAYLVNYNSATQTFTTVDLRSGSPDGTDTINGIENFQFADGMVTSSVLAAASVHAPVLTVPASNISVSAGQSLQVSSLFSATDADGDALTYYFYDGSAAANSGHFVLNGTAIADGTSFSVNAAQLAQLVFATGAAGSSDDLSMQVTDGQAVSGVGQVHVNTTVNHAPILTGPASDISASAGRSLQMSSLFSATDADNDALTYYFYDSNPAADSGHFVLNGAPIAAGISFGVNAAQLAQLSFVAGAAGTSDDLSMQVSDGRAVSSVGQFHVDAAVKHAPVLTVTTSNPSAAAGQSLQVSSWFSATDADNDALSYYFYDGSTAANSGHFSLNGTAIAAGTSFGVSAAQLSQLTFVAGAAGTSDDLSMQLSDGQAVSGIGQFHVDIANHAPTLTVFDFGAITGTKLPAVALFIATDADNDPLTYYFQDENPDPNSGHFEIDGTAVPAGTSFGINGLSGFAGVFFVGGTGGITDEVDVQVSDGHSVSNVGILHINSINSNFALTNEAISSAPDGIPGMFRALAGDDGQFHFGLPAASPAAEVHANDVAVLHLNQDVAPGAVLPGNAPAAMVHPDLFGDAIALHELHPLAHVADYFMV